MENGIIADIFNRAGLIEKWGRGTNRVIAMCREAGIASPTFEEITGAAVVTFKVNVLGPGRQQIQRGGKVTAQVGPRLESTVPDRVLGTGSLLPRWGGKWLLYGLHQGRPHSPPAGKRLITH